VPGVAGHRFDGPGRHSGNVRTAYRCRAYPDQTQQAVLNRTFGCVRVVWNRSLAERYRRYHAEGTSLSYAASGAALTAMKKDPDLAFLNVSSVPLQQALRHQHQAFSAFFAEPPEPWPETGRAVGVDLGVQDFAVTSEGEKIANPRHLERKARNLARYQRRLARCQNGSANRAKARAKVARAHRKVRNARRDFLHRASTRLVRGNDIVVIEDLAVKNMVRNRHLARVISDCGWAEFRRQLEYKCAWYRRQLVVIDRWYPSSKICSACGHLLAELSLSIRTWQCPSCGTRHDRDINAAKNILAAGQAVTACGADVRHSGTSRVQSAVKQEPQPVTAGIPIPQGGE
jgi:putative transposase